MFDANIDGDNLVVIYRLYLYLTADIKMVGSPVNNTIAKTGEAITVGVDPMRSVILSAAIEGSIKEGNLAVLVKNTTGQTSRFVRKGEKWVKQNASTPLNVEAQTPLATLPEDDNSPLLTIFEKRPAVSKSFSEGLFVMRERLQESSRPKGFGELPPELQLVLPKQSHLYRAEEYRWRDGKTPGEEYGDLSFSDLWSLRVDDFTTEDSAGDLKVYDAQHEPQGEKAGVFVVVYLHNGTLAADVVRPNQRGQRLALAIKDAVLLDKVAPEQIVSAKLSGSAETNTLKVEVRSANGSSQSFALQNNRWIKQP